MIGVKERPPMPYKSIEINRKKFTIIGIYFSSVNNFDAVVNTLGTVMFESNQNQWYTIGGCQWLKK